MKSKMTMDFVDASNGGAFMNILDPCDCPGCDCPN